MYPWLHNSDFLGWLDAHSDDYNIPDMNSWYQRALQGKLTPGQAGIVDAAMGDWQKTMTGGKLMEGDNPGSKPMDEMENTGGYMTPELNKYGSVPQPSVIDNPAIMAVPRPTPIPLINRNRFQKQIDTGAQNMPPDDMQNYVNQQMGVSSSSDDGSSGGSSSSSGGSSSSGPVPIPKPNPRRAPPPPPVKSPPKKK